MLFSDKKKKKKKKPKRNQTGPSLDEDEDLPASSNGYAMSSTLNGLDLQDGPRSWGSTGGSGGQSRSLLRASRSPRLETLQEPENGEEGRLNLMYTCPEKPKVKVMK